MATCFVKVLLTFYILKMQLSFSFDLTERYDRCLVLYNTPKGSVYSACWKISDEEITFEVHVQTLGWIGLGFSPNGAMAGSDMVVGGFKEGKAYLNDYHAIGSEQPLLDVQQDYTLLDGLENGTHTLLKYKRRLSTCDKHDWIINADTVRLIWAYCDEDVDNPANFKRHINVGSRSVIFLEDGKGSEENFVSNVIHYDLNVTKVSIPVNSRTLYLCKIFKMPPLPKHHIIKYEVLMSSVGQRFLHHLVVFHCFYDMSKYVDKQERCFNEDHTKASDIYKCTSRYIAGWGLGAEPVVFDSDSGYPLFEENGSPYLMVEFHYSNPDHVTGAYDDSSGIRFHLTPVLRQKEIGSFVMGMGFDNNTILLPPGQKKITLSFACNFNCTRSLPESGINIIGGWMHQHMHGIGIRLRHIRDNIELPPIFEDNNYDFKFQQRRQLSKHRLVLPNDTLLVECEWNTESQKKMTFGGYDFLDEMCLLFVDYYPKTDKLLSCMGGPSQETYAKAFEANVVVRHKAETLPILVSAKNGQNISLSDYTNLTNWTMDKNIKILENFQNTINSGWYYQYCSSKFEENSNHSAYNENITLAQNGVRFIEKLREIYFESEPLMLPKVPFVAPTPVCKTKSNYTTDRPYNLARPKVTKPTYLVTLSAIFFNLFLFNCLFSLL